VAIDKLKALIEAIEGTDVVEAEIEDPSGLKLRIRRAEAGRLIPSLVPAAAAMVSSASAMASGSASSARLAPASAAPALGAPSEPAGHVMTSPIVGTFYSAPDPNAPAFVKVGDRVKKGQVVCIVEAMKLMNEIEADVAGEIVKIHHENGQPVQFGEALFTIAT
jgi:acetyl-CoA carboxylase biotin carboxyl carrier protein